MSSIPSRAKRGYLFKLSGRSLLQKNSWKRKFFVLWEGQLYYYDSSEGGGGEGGGRGCGVIHLKYYSRDGNL